MTNNLTRSHGEATIERFQKDPNLASDLLAAILIDGDKDELLQALRLVAKIFPADYLAAILVDGDEYRLASRSSKR